MFASVVQTDGNEFFRVSGGTTALESPHFVTCTRPDSHWMRNTNLSCTHARQRVKCNAKPFSTGFLRDDTTTKIKCKRRHVCALNVRRHFRSSLIRRNRSTLCKSVGAASSGAFGGNRLKGRSVSLVQCVSETAGWVSGPGRAQAGMGSVVSR